MKNEIERLKEENSNLVKEIQDQVKNIEETADYFYKAIDGFEATIKRLKSELAEQQTYQTQLQLELGPLRVDCEKLKDALMEFYTDECPDYMKELLKGREVGKLSEQSEGQDALWKELMNDCFLSEVWIKDLKSKFKLTRV